VPRQSQQDRSVAAVIVVVVLLKPLCDSVVHLLVVLEAWYEERGFCLLAEELWLPCVQAVDTRSHEQSTGAEDQARWVALEFIWPILRAGCVAALRLLAEGRLRGYDEARRACRRGAEAGSGGAQGAIEGSRDGCHGGVCVLSTDRDIRVAESDLSIDCRCSGWSQLALKGDVYEKRL
jgi:hypothetical protein